MEWDNCDITIISVQYGWELDSETFLFSLDKQLSVCVFLCPPIGNQLFWPTRSDACHAYGLVFILVWTWGCIVYTRFGVLLSWFDVYLYCIFTLQFSIVSGIILWECSGDPWQTASIMTPEGQLMISTLDYPLRAMSRGFLQSFEIRIWFMDSRGTSRICAQGFVFDIGLLVPMRRPDIRMRKCKHLFVRMCYRFAF